jgi:hypothetical protein
MENSRKELAIAAQKVIGWHRGRTEHLRQREHDLQRVLITAECNLLSDAWAAA